MDGLHHLAEGERGRRPSTSARRRSATQACAEAEKQSPGHCDIFHAADEAYFKDVYYWNTPTKTCLDGRGDICTDFDAWTKVWTEIKG